jgi:outer membrane immunogenic protein
MVVCAIIGVSAASAADLSAPVYTKAPAVVAPPVYNWAGFYVGLNGGGGSSHETWTENSGFLGLALATPIGEGSHNATGGLAGGQIGYRWQASNWVFGVEAQGDWADFKGSNISTVPLAVGVLTNQTKIDAIGLFTGQVGYAWNNVLWYAKGGAAVTDNKYSGVAVLPAPLGPGVSDTAGETRWGGAVGTGLEIGFAPGWSVAFEYDHLFMGSSNDTFTISAPAGALVGLVNRVDSIRQDIDIGTVRLNYTFGGPVVARY